MNEQFRANISARYGQAGVLWLNRLPIIINLCAKRWGLRDLQIFSNLKHNYVMSGMRNNENIVLKLGPESWTLNTEASVLRAFAGYGSVELLDRFEGALLLKQAIPGISLRAYYQAQEEQELAIFCEVSKRLHELSPTPSSFLHIREWLAEIDNPWPLPPEILKKARDLKEKLLSTSGPDRLLHGDLHHGNIIKSNNNWLIIDPKGVIGEALFDAAAFIRNPKDLLYADLEASRRIEKRIKYIAHSFNEDALRLARWAFVGAILAWIWALQDNCKTHEYEQFIKNLVVRDLF